MRAALAARPRLRRKVGQRPRGFTLVELMAVVALTTVLASMAILAMRKTRTQGDVDKFANAIRAAMLQARRRSTATRQPYMVDMQKRTVRWCRLAYDPATMTTTQTTCPPADLTYETGALVRAGVDAQASKFAASADVKMPNYAYAAPAKVDLPKPIYFGPNGTVGENFKTVMGLRFRDMTGVTVYLEPISTAGDAVWKRRRVLSYGVSARPRIIDNW